MSGQSFKPLPLRGLAVFSELVSVSRPKKILEFGSWQGRSAVTLLTAAEKQGLSTEIMCVDTWLGSLEHWQVGTSGSEWSYDQLAVVEGEPRILETFMANVEAHGFLEQVRILRCETRNCTSYVKANFPGADLVYVDADHSTEAVLRDIDIAYDVAPGALVSGDDWAWETVRLAVVQFATKNRLSILCNPRRNTWVLIKPEQAEMARSLESLGWSRVNPLAERVDLFFQRVVPKPLRKGVKRIRRKVRRLLHM